MRPTPTRFLNLQVLQKLGVPAAGEPLRDPAALSLGISIVRKVLKENHSPNGWRTQDIYKLALKETAPPTFQSSLELTHAQAKPPHLEHPIRSKTFLKEVLAHMQGYKDIRLVREVQQREGSSTAHPAFVWKLFDKSVLPNPPRVIVRAPSLGLPLGLHEDVSHLNKRRQRARKEKIVRGILKLKAAKADEGKVAPEASSSASS